jgi:zinc transport system substrate-binding protein
MKKTHLSPLIFLSLSLLLSCGKSPTDSVKPVVAVSIPPQKYFVEKIAGDLVDVLVMVPPGASPHTYEPKPSQMAILSKAKVYFAIGIALEKAWIGLLAKTCPAMTIVHTDSGIQKIAFHDPDARENGEGLDPHIWLSPELVKQQAAAITDALCRMDTLHASLFRKNDSLFMVHIDTLQQDIRRTLSSLTSNRRFMVFHPAWGYFAQEFGLVQIAIEVEGKEPSPAELGRVFDIAKKDSIKTIYVQPQLSKRSAQIIAAEIGAHVAVADDLAEEWAANLLRCAEAIGKQEP